MTLARAVGLICVLFGSFICGCSAQPHTSMSIIAGSEVRDLEPYLPDIKRATGIDVKFDYSGTLSGIDRLRSGANFDAAWFSQAHYFEMSDPARIYAQTQIMLSPVIVGVKMSAARRLGWLNNPNIGWKEIAKAAGAGQFSFAMTNPTSSNSGLCAVIGVAAGFAGGADTITAADIDGQGLRDFYVGQHLASGSSAPLVDEFTKEQAQLDGIVSYESTLIALNKSRRLTEPLALIYPREGVVTANYPLILLKGERRSDYDKLVAYLTGRDFQQLVMEKTFRRPVNPAVKISDAFPQKLVVDLAFPARLSIVDKILQAYLTESRAPAHDYYLLDTSGSMSGERLAKVRGALVMLAGSDNTLSGRFDHFQDREKISLVAFNSTVEPPLELEKHGPDDEATLAAMQSYVANLHAWGGTAMFAALEKTLVLAAQDRRADPNRYYSIVLITDGDNNRAPSFDAFRTYYLGLPKADRIKIFPVFIGTTVEPHLEDLAAISGGHYFDGTHGSFDEVLKEVRGYQ